MFKNHETPAKEQKSKRMPVVHRGLALHVDECPAQRRVWHGKPYANVIDDCSYCKYNCGIEYDRDETVAVLCSGYVDAHTPANI